MKQIEYELSAEPTKHSERVVVDEVFDDGSARLLRARYTGAAAGKKATHQLAIPNWGKERAFFMAAWRFEAYVGYRGRVHLQEGDVFYIRDGKSLKTGYDPIARDKARAKHLLVDFEKSGKIARADITRQYRLLNVAQATPVQRRREILQQRVRKLVAIPLRRLARRAK